MKGEPVKPIWRLLSCIRYKEVLVLQGTPIMGLVFSIEKPTAANIPVAVLFALANCFLVAHIWTLNDWADIHSDTIDRSRSARVFTSKGIAPALMLWFSIALLVASLCL